MSLASPSTTDRQSCCGLCNHTSLSTNSLRPLRPTSTHPTAASATDRSAITGSWEALRPPNPHRLFARIWTTRFRQPDLDRMKWRALFAVQVLPRPAAAPGACRGTNYSNVQPPKPPVAATWLVEHPRRQGERCFRLQRRARKVRIRLGVARKRRVRRRAIGPASRKHMPTDLQIVFIPGLSHPRAARVKRCGGGRWLGRSGTGVWAVRRRLDGRSLANGRCH
jgi:hypothetical protein